VLWQLKRAQLVQQKVLALAQLNSTLMEAEEQM
jgi:hypothetical protein